MRADYSGIVIAVIFRFDLTGFDTRLPDAEDIEYATLVTDTGARYGNFYKIYKVVFPFFDA